MSLLYTLQLKKENDYLKELCKDSYKLVLRKLRENHSLKKKNHKLLKSETELMQVIRFLKNEIRNDFPGFDEMMQFENLSKESKELILS